MHGFQFSEKYLSQIPALQELVNLSYKYLTPEQVFKARRKKFGDVLLENILRQQIKKINRINYKGREYRFSEENVQSAIQKIKNVQYAGLLKTNETVYDLLTLGTAMEQSIEGDTKSFTLNYVDWRIPTNNAFHVTAEFPVERTRSTETARPDIVLFVNGIPFAVIECKSPGEKVEAAISQTIRNQTEEYIPRLFIHAQLLMSINKNDARYATVGTEQKFWSLWREQEDSEKDVERVVNTPLQEETKNALFSGDFAAARRYFDDLGARQVTEQDRAIYSLCRPERLMELSRLFTLFDAGKKKIARYQQFFVVRSALERVKTFDNEGRRKGGMIWHTQGSGKSLTMVWLARLLAMDKEITNARLVMATDRKDLDRHIEKVFRQCGIEPERAATGRELLELVRSKTPVVTSLVHKFDKALNAGSLNDDDPSVFVLVDESHRTQFGNLSARMRQMLPKACYLGFTGTPLTNEQRNNFVKFGGLIQPSYSVRQALDDEAIVPLLYEGRHVEMEQDKASVDLWFERYTADLSEKQKTDLKKKYSRANTLNKAKRVVYMRAFDISEHYRANWQGTGFKGQLVAPDKATAIQYHHFMREIEAVSSEVVISAPDMREGFEEVDEEPNSEVRNFWDKMMKRFGSETEYSENIIERFKSAEEPEILIVVDKLLTGFDAPVNSVLYLCRKLREHTLLQAIARVNRLHEGKDFGYIVDYEGILGELNTALTMYDALEGFDEKDLERTLVSVNEQIEKLPQTRSHLWDVFREVKNQADEEEYERLLGDDARREDFYGLLAEYAKTLAVALSSHKFLTDTDEAALRHYREDLKRFENLRKSVKLRYADTVDYREHEPKIKKLLDTHIQADTVTQINKPENIFHGLPTGESEPEVEYGSKTEASRADSIAHLMKRTISERMEEDPAFYQKFSNLIQRVIDDFRAERLSGVEYLEKVSKLKKDFDSRGHEDVPEKLRLNGDAAAFFGVIQPVFETSGCPIEMCDENSADTALAIHAILQCHGKVHFWDDPDARNSAINDIEDYLYDEVKAKRGIALNSEQLDKIIERTMRIARNRTYG
ncbi:MAG: HsdR family type I site-specific deoxyribonuclease [Nitrospira sp.]|nr:HsdR family type I site-specific deoxyribonuclease [Nitrospira sp.]